MNTYLNLWEAGEKTRIYVNNHPRTKMSKIYLRENLKDGTIATGSINIDQPSRYVMGDVSGKRLKDRQATTDVLMSYGWSKSCQFSDLLQAVKNKELQQIRPCED